MARPHTVTFGFNKHLRNLSDATPITTFTSIGTPLCRCRAIRFANGNSNQAAEILGSAQTAFLGRRLRWTHRTSTAASTGSQNMVERSGPRRIRRQRLYVAAKRKCGGRFCWRKHPDADGETTQTLSRLERIVRAKAGPDVEAIVETISLLAQEDETYELVRRRAFINAPDILRRQIYEMRFKSTFETAEQYLSLYLPLRMAQMVEVASHRASSPFFGLSASTVKLILH